jgi:fatty-acyl-CoA synthase
MVMGNLAATSHGAAMIIPAPAFDPKLTLAAVAAERCTSLYGVPTMFIAELAEEDFEFYELSSLRTGIMAGSPCPVEVMKQVVSRMGMTEVQICYGMTETSPVSTQTRADDSLERRVSTVGRVLPHVEVKIIEPETGLTVPRGTPGELCTRGYSVMLGYWEEPEKTAEAIDAARWMHTGDLGIMDSDGYLNITGRIKDMVIRGGENIYPREIEEFLYTHPDVLDAQVVGVPDERYGEELCAWIRMRPGAEPLTAEAVREFAAGKLAHYKIPRYIQIVDEFPMTVTGKVRKVEMRERSIESLDLTSVARTKHA